ncbi:MAG: hypothetical protein AAB449_01955 [Patescibacteria group bacterium]
MKKLLVVCALVFAAGMTPVVVHAGSQTFSTAGTYAFTVPPFTGTMTIDVQGAGGGGGGGTLIMSRYPYIYEYGGRPGSTGWVTYVTTAAGTITANAGGGGGGGQVGAGNPAPPPGSSGTASGGNGSNTTGGGSSGGAGGNYAAGNNGVVTSYGSHWYFSGAPGGAGGRAVSTFAPGVLAMGSSITVVIGTGGIGGLGGDDYYGDAVAPPGGAGTPGVVTITWGDRANTAPAAPTIAGLNTATTNISNSFTLSAVDPEGDPKRFGIDWDNNGSIDLWTPASSFTGSSVIVARTWSSVGTYTFAVVAQDAGYLVSATSTKTVVVSLPASQPLTCNGSAETYSTANTYPRTVPASYSTMVVEVWGGGAGGGGGMVGQSGSASSFAGTLLGGGGIRSSGSTGGAGGSASGGDINISGASGSSTASGAGGRGGYSPNGGMGGAGGAGSTGFFGLPPGGGGGGGGSFFVVAAGGGGGGGYAKKTYTSATLAPGAPVTLVVAAGAAGGGSTGAFGVAAGGVGAAGRIKVVCTPQTPTVTIDSDAPLVSGTKTINVGDIAHVTATYTAEAGDTLVGSAINGANQVSSVPCANISPYNATCWLQPDATKVYTFSTTTLGTYTFYAAAKTTNLPTFTNYNTTSVTVVAAPSLSILANGQANQLTVDPGDSPTISWTTSSVQAGSCRVSNSIDSTVWTGDSSAGQSTGPLGQDITYTLNCNNLAGTPVNPVTVGILVVPLLPTLNGDSLTLTPIRARIGGTVIVSWNVSGFGAGTTCSISPALASGVASFTGSGSWVGSDTSLPIEGRTTFTLTCVNEGSVSISKTVNLVPLFKEL